MKRKNKIIKAIKDSILCIRFPFLYPRNRFDGKHHAGILMSKTHRLYNQAIQEVYITGKLEHEQCKFPTEVLMNNINAILNKDDKTLIIKNHIGQKIHSIKRLLWNDNRFEILGISSNYPNIITVHVKVRDENDTTNYGFSYETIELLKNKTKYCLYKIVKWIDKKILDRIFIIPAYTELDSMPQGWRNAFGMDLCKELKTELKKHGALKNYRIMQIKEKFGGLRWYDNRNTKHGYEIIQKYENLSYYTCINCGKPATRISTGWISPYCDDCLKQNYIPISEKNAWDKAYLGDRYKENEE